MPPQHSSSRRFLPHAVGATFCVLVLPALAASAIDASGRPWLLLASVLLAMGLSVLAAAVGSAIWMRRPESRDLVFGDLMLWGWLRKLRAERRLTEARELLGLGTSGGEQRQLSRERLCEILEQLGGQLEAQDAYTHGHTRRVTRHSERIARELGLTAAQVAKVRTAAALHDVGKVHTPRAVLNKPGRLTDEEFAIVKRHPVDGAEMVTALGDAEVTAMVRHHHERLDGTGYPDGLTSDEIPLGARIISVADTFDAITSSRPYRSASKHKKALDILAKEAGTQLDPAAVAAFQRYYSGRGSVAWSAFLLTAPQRLLSWAGGLLQGAGAGALPLAQGIGAMGAAALLGGSLGAQAAPAGAVLQTASYQQAGQLQDTRSKAESKKARDERRARRDKAAGGKRKQRKSGGDKRSDEKRSKGPSGGGPVPGGGSGGGGPSQGGSGGGGSGGGGSGGGGQSPLPKVEVPEVKVPEVKVPEVKVPEVKVPDVQVPDVQVPGVQVPDVELPNVRLP